MKFYVLLILFLCIDYAFLTCDLDTDNMDVKKSDCLSRNVGENEVPEEQSHTPNTCCLITTSGTIGDQTIVQSYCAALEKEKASDLEKERNEKYKSLGTTTIECEDTSKLSDSTASQSSDSTTSQSTYIRYGLISFLLLLL